MSSRNVGLAVPLYARSIMLLKEEHDVMELLYVSTNYKLIN